MRALPWYGLSRGKAIHEILIPDDRLRKALSPQADLEVALDSGMKTLLHNGLEKAAQGITWIEEVLRVASPGLGD